MYYSASYTKYVRSSCSFLDPMKITSWLTHTQFLNGRERNVTLNTKNFNIGIDTIPFVGYDIDAKGINMSQSTIVFCKPTSLKELQSFMSVVNYFKDHLRDHSAVDKPPYDTVASTTKQKTKSLAWTQIVTSRLRN